MTDHRRHRRVAVTRHLLNEPWLNEDMRSLVESAAREHARRDTGTWVEVWTCGKDRAYCEAKWIDTLDTPGPRHWHRILNQETAA